jgi:hypothetical protein
MTDLVEVYALDSLGGQELVDFEAHLAFCSDCDAQLAEAETVLAALVPDSTAPSGVWARIEADLDPPSEVAAPLRRRVSMRVPTAIAAAVIIALGGVVLAQRNQGSEQTSAVAAERAAEEPGTSEARFVADGVTLAEVVLSVGGAGYILPTDDLPALDESRTYQLWVVNDDGAVISGGVLGNDPEVSTFTWTDGVSGLILTREKAGGVGTSEGDVVSVITGI